MWLFIVYRNTRNHTTKSYNSHKPFWQRLNGRKLGEELEENECEPDSFPGYSGSELAVYFSNLH